MRPVSRLFQNYIDVSDIAESTAEVKDRAKKKFIECFGDLDIELINYSHVEDYKVLLAKENSKSTANTYMANLKPFFEWCVKRNYIEFNPFDGLSLYTVPESETKLFSPQDIESLIKVADARWQVFVLLAAVGGLRRGESLNLIVTDIHFDESFIQVTPKKESLTTWRYSIKNHTCCSVPFPETVQLPNMIVDYHTLMISLIEQLKGSQPYIMLTEDRYNLELERRAKGDMNHRHRGCPYGNFSRDFKLLCKRARIEPKEYRKLRTTLGTETARHFSLVDTQKILRHKSPQTTARYYIKVDQDELIRRSNKVSQKFYASNVS